MIRIHGTGCCLIDFLYPRLDFNAPAFQSRLSKKDGDGGLGIGKLVFAEDFERFAGMPYESVLEEIAGKVKPSHNLGGPSAVSLVHAAQILGDRAQVSFYGARGNDKTGDLVEEAFARLGFAPAEKAPEKPGARYFLKRYDTLTPRTDVLSDPAYDNGHGERTFINLIGAAGHLTRGDLGDDFFDADIIAFGGTGLTPLIHDSITELLFAAKQKKALTVVNLVYDYRSEQGAQGKKWKLGKDDDAYPHIDLLIADRDEAVKTSGCSSVAEAAAWFLERGCGAAVITEGSRPVHLAAGKGIFKEMNGILPVSEGIDRELAAHPERRGDTTGCGDNFAGGIIVGLAEALAEQTPGGTEKLDLREICIPGIIAGGYACFILGGVFYETRTREKRELLAPFIEAYKEDTMSFDFDEVIERRGFGSHKWDGVAKDILPMFVADMDFMAAPQIREALQKTLDHGIFGYGYEPDLPGVLARWIKDEYRQEIREDWIVLLPAIVPVLAAVSHLRPGRILINTPNYHVLLAAPLKAGKETILSPLKNTTNTAGFEHYEFDFEDMNRRIEPDVKLFYLCNPQNPVGRVYTREELIEVNRFAKEKNLIVISDEAHCGLVFDRPHTPYFTLDEYAANHSITIMGPGKTFNLAGLPFGFAIIPNKELRDDYVKTCYALPSPGIFNVAAARAAYGQCREWQMALVDYLRGNRDFFEKALVDNFPGIKLTHVEGTYLQWVDFRPLGIDEPFKWLQEKAKILPNEGKSFGAQGEGYVRINFGAPRSRLEEAIQRIRAALP
ncbi:hypothetical protein AGMMS49928_03160 [Spirochaetia bacterium]|nr:hypothetical protein AGMMS49928_03160 [Spirochaetia bacterium]